MVSCFGVWGQSCIQIPFSSDDPKSSAGSSEDFSDSGNADDFSDSERRYK